MDKKYTPVLRVPVPTADQDPENARCLGDNKFKEPLRNVLEIPFYLKLVTPYLIRHYPDLILFMRHDVRKYPKLKVVENGPYPYPFIEVYNIELKLLYEIDITFKTRQQLNKLMRDYDQLPVNSLDRINPPDLPEQDILKDVLRKIALMGPPLFPS